MGRHGDAVKNLKTKHSAKDCVTALVYSGRMLRILQVPARRQTVGSDNQGRTQQGGRAVARQTPKTEI